MEYCGQKTKLVRNDQGELELVGNQSLFDIPLTARFRALVWYGTADGTLLTPGFNLQDILDRTMVLKSFRIIPYAADDYVDLYVSDGVTNNEETIPTNARLDRVFGVYPDSCSVNCNINGNPIGVFSQASGIGYFPVDLWLDNIFYWYPEKLSSWTISVVANVFSQIRTGAEDQPLVKVLVECYLL